MGPLPWSADEWPFLTLVLQSGLEAPSEVGLGEESRKVPWLAEDYCVDSSTPQCEESTCQGPRLGGSMVVDPI